ncbi:MAG: hypothetical protein HUJ54_04985 [Erysipelotrichaceae bacterium]|nr:hypothetical protein [Erysipelotrichaceae bacterium]
MPAADRIQEIQRQIQLHNHLKNWLKVSFVACSIAAALFWFALQASVWAAAAAGILLTLTLLAMLIIGYGYYKSYNQIQGKLQSLKEGRA